MFRDLIQRHMQERLETESGKSEPRHRAPKQSFQILHMVLLSRRQRTAACSETLRTEFTHRVDTELPSVRRRLSNP